MSRSYAEVEEYVVLPLQEFPGNFGGTGTSRANDGQLWLIGYLIMRDLIRSYSGN